MTSNSWVLIIGYFSIIFFLLTSAVIFFPALAKAKETAIGIFDNLRVRRIKTLMLLPIMLLSVGYAGTKAMEQVVFVTPVQKGAIEVGADYIDISWTMKDHMSKSQYRVLRAKYDELFGEWVHTNKMGRTDIVPILPEWRTGAVSNFWYCGYSSPNASTTLAAGNGIDVYYATNNIYSKYATKIAFDPNNYGSCFVREMNDEAYKEIAVVTGETSYRDSGIDPTLYNYKIEYIRPDIVTGDDIKITNFQVGRFKKGLYMSWEVTDTITVGEDEFIIQKCWRAIPFRRTYTNWQIIGTTKETEWRDNEAHWHQDEKYRVIVLKEIEEDEEE